MSRLVIVKTLDIEPVMDLRVRLCTLRVVRKARASYLSTYGRHPRSSWLLHNAPLSSTPGLGKALPRLFHKP